MGSGEREQWMRYMTVGNSLSSLIVRPSENEGGEGGEGGVSGGANDYEPGEVHREKNKVGSNTHSKNRSHNHRNGHNSYKDRSPLRSHSPRYSGSPLRSRPRQIRKTLEWDACRVYFTIASENETCRVCFSFASENACWFSVTSILEEIGSPLWF